MSSVTVSQNVLHDPENGECHNVWTVMLLWLVGGDPHGDYEILTDNPDRDEITAAAKRLRSKHGLAV